MLWSILCGVLSGVRFCIHYGMGPCLGGCTWASAAGLVLQCFAAWMSGRHFFTSRMADGFADDLIPFYAVGHRAGLFWLCLVLGVRTERWLSITMEGWLPPIELWAWLQVMSSFATYSWSRGCIDHHGPFSVPTVSSSWCLQASLQYATQELEDQTQRTCGTRLENA